MPSTLRICRWAPVGSARFAVGLVVLSVAPLIAPPAGAFQTTLGAAALSTQADENTDTLFLFAQSPPYSATHSQSAAGTQSSAIYTFDNDELLIEFEHSHASDSVSSQYAGSTGLIQFSVDSDVLYLLDGIYQADDDSLGDWILLEAKLIDNSAGAISLFENSQASDSTVDESFDLGLAEGDSANVLLGSLTGLLVAGHTYTLEYTAEIEDRDLCCSSTLANGHIRLQLTAIPEPSTALSVGLGLAALSGARRRRRGSRSSRGYPARARKGSGSAG